jgi:[acyl-carrier-protein] S-malonyltransferase
MSQVPSVLLFPGQGTEAVGMSEGWADLPEWQTALDSAERHTGLPLRVWMAQGPGSCLKAQRHAPISGIAHSVGIFRAHRAAGMPLPTAAAGHSLGFFSTLVAAGVVELEAALDLVQNTEDLADARFEAGSMGMAFVIGMREDQLRGALAGQPELALSNINGKAQFTVSGPLPSLETLVARLAPDCLRAGLLPVRQPLHGRHMAPLLPALTRRLSGIKPRDPLFPALSMCDGRILRRGEEAWDEAIASIALPVDWPCVVAALSGFEGPWRECGHGNQLAGLTRWIDRNRLVEGLSPAFKAAGTGPC